MDVDSQLQAQTIFSEMKELQVLGVHQSWSEIYGKLKSFLPIAVNRKHDCSVIQPAVCSLYLLSYSRS